MLAAAGPEGRAAPGMSTRGWAEMTEDSALQFEVITTGLRYPEGPIAMADGSVLVVEINGGALTRVRAGGEQEVIAQLGGAPNGAAVGPDGAVYVCNNGGSMIITQTGDERGVVVRHNPDYVGGSIQRVDLATGDVSTLYERCDGRALNSPNDIVFDREGGFWFTCFGHSDGEVRQLGGIYYALADGSSIRRCRNDQMMANGICLSPDQRTLYWGDSILQKLWAVEILGPGEIPPPEGPAAGRPVITMAGLQWPDGLAVEESGRVCMATLFNGGVTVVDPGAGTSEHHPVPDPITTNLAFGAADMRDAWITGSSTGTLLKCRWPRPGLKLNFNA